MADKNTTIPKGWKLTTLGEVISSRIVSNYNNKRFPLSSKDRLAMKGGYPYYGAASAIDFINDFRFDGFYLLIAEDGTVFDGKSPMLQLVSGKFWVSNHSHVLKGQSKVMTKFLFYLLKNVKIAPYITGAVQPKLTKENLYFISFLMPEKEEEQCAIASVLSSFDDKIELLREQNKTLEATAQAIFKEWFVNFNFPNQDNRPYKKSGGKMIDSELGEIPEGWRVGRLGDIFTIEYGRSDKKIDKDGDFLVYGAGGMIGYSNSSDYKGFQVIIGCRGTCGNITLIYKDSKITHNSLIITNDWFRPFSYLFLQIINVNKAITGSTQPQITIGDLKNIQIYIPKYCVIKLFSDNIRFIFKKIGNNNNQIQTLSKLRDTLLPKLMKGEMRVKGFNS